MAQTEQLQISRTAPNQPWGFRLQGGKDFNMPIIIQKVNAGSPAEKAGLRAGDAVISIGGQNAIEMRHKECQDAIIHSGNAISMEVQRGGLASLRPPGAAQQQPVPKPTQPPRNRNPFRVIKNVDTADGSVKALVHNQFNSPMPLYSEEKIAETLSAQTEVLAGGALGVDFKKNEKKYDGNMSEVLKMVQDMDQNPQSHAEPPEEAVDSAPLDPDYSGLNSIKSRSMRSLMVKPDGHGAPQTSVHAPRIVPQQQTKVPPPVAPKPAAPMSPQPAPMAPQAAPANRGPPGMRSTSATMIKTDPSTGSVKLVTAVDTETKHFNAFNRTPQSFKPSPAAGSYQPISAPAAAPAPAPAPTPAPAPAPAPVSQQYQTQQYQQQSQQFQQQSTQQFHQQSSQQSTQKSHLYGAGSSGISQVDYTSYVPQRKGGISHIACPKRAHFKWPPPHDPEQTTASPIWYPQAGSGLPPHDTPDFHSIHDMLEPVVAAREKHQPPFVPPPVGPEAREWHPPAGVPGAREDDDNLPEGRTGGRDRGDRSPSPLPHLLRRRAELEVETAAAARAGDASEEEYRAQLERVAQMERDVKAWCREQPLPADVPSLSELSAQQKKMISETAAAVRSGSPLPNRRVRKFEPARDSGLTQPQKMEDEQRRDEERRSEPIGAFDDVRESLMAKEENERRIMETEAQKRTEVSKNTETASDSVDRPMPSDHSKGKCVKFAIQDDEEECRRQTDLTQSSHSRTDQSYERTEKSSSMQIMQESQSSYAEKTSMSSQSTHVSSSRSETSSQSMSRWESDQNDENSPQPEVVDGSAYSMPESVGYQRQDEPHLEAVESPHAGDMMDQSDEVWERLESSRRETMSSECSRETRFNEGAEDTSLPPSNAAAPKPVIPKPAAPPAPSIGGPGKLGFNGGLPGLSGLGTGGGGGGGGGKGSTAGRNAPRRGRGTMNPAATAGSRIPVCHTCGNQIRGPFITALGQCWCPACFVCATANCRCELEHIGFVEVDGQTYCEKCWETSLAPICFKCQKRIKGDCLKAIGKSYHPECFACAYCGGLFGNSAFFLEDGLPYCENDWNELFTTKCVGCGFPIEAGDRWVEALNKNFHSQCFKCAICGNNLEGQSFFAKQGRPFCKHHARM